jgi:hypothetical protein
VIVTAETALGSDHSLSTASTAAPLLSVHRCAAHTSCTCITSPGSIDALLLLLLLLLKRCSNTCVKQAGLHFMRHASRPARLVTSLQMLRLQDVD